MLETPSVTGIFNVGTGKARSFKDLIGAMYAALGRAPNIEYVDMPAAIRDSYQYFTQAEVANLQRAGYNAGFAPLEDCGAPLRHPVPRSRRPVPLSMLDFEKRLQSIGQQTMLCVGDLMLDDFVYGEVGAHFAGSAGAGAGGEAQRGRRSAAPATSRAISPRSARAASSSAWSATTTPARDVIARLQAEPLIEPSSGRRSVRVRRRARCASSRSISRRICCAPTGSRRGRSSAEREGELIARALAALPRVGAVVLSDYAKGVLTPRRHRARSSRRRTRRGTPVIVDPKAADYSVYRGATVIKPNRKELAETTPHGRRVGRRRWLPAAAQAHAGSRHAGRAGARSAKRADAGAPRAARRSTCRPIRSRCATCRARATPWWRSLAVMLAARADFEVAVRVANAAAAVVVGKRGTATVSADELRHRVLPASTLAAGGQDRLRPLAARRAARRVAPRSGCASASPMAASICCIAVTSS